MDKFLANNLKNEPIENMQINDLYTKIGKDLGDKFIIENNNLKEKQEDGSYKDIATFPNSGSNGDSVLPENLNYTKEKSQSTYNKPYIPSSFEYVEGTWDTGLVIKNKTDGNEFVWIPVDGTKVKYDKVDFAVTHINYADTTDDTIPVANELKNVTTYGGFYIGRYEAGTQNKRTTSGDAPKQDLIIKPGVSVYNYVTYDQAKTLADGLYTRETDCVSGLTTGTQWDTACMFLGKDYADNSTGKGNYYDDDPSNNPGLTGAKKEYSLKNVYDMAGNTWEWINEFYYSFYGVFRGGNFLSSGSRFPAGYRSYDNVGGSYGNVAFRVSLYIK